mmetsp:Transcript_7081/g.16750  ORF Transcript_7081/g.16750 Transcript_7081/m.16750 type:complete len:446 (+) Transcript_7081:544-1881(+)
MTMYGEEGLCSSTNRALSEASSALFFSVHNSSQSSQSSSQVPSRCTSVRAALKGRLPRSPATFSFSLACSSASRRRSHSILKLWRCTRFPTLPFSTSLITASRLELPLADLNLSSACSRSVHSSSKKAKSTFISLASPIARRNRSLPNSFLPWISAVSHRRRLSRSSSKGDRSTCAWQALIASPKSALPSFSAAACMSCTAFLRFSLSVLNLPRCTLTPLSPAACKMALSKLSSPSAPVVVCRDTCTRCMNVFNLCTSTPTASEMALSRSELPLANFAASRARSTSCRFEQSRSSSSVAMFSFFTSPKARCRGPLPSFSLAACSFFSAPNRLLHISSPCSQCTFEAGCFAVMSTLCNSALPCWRIALDKSCSSLERLARSCSYVLRLISSLKRLFCSWASSMQRASDSLPIFSACSSRRFSASRRRPSAAFGGRRSMIKVSTSWL